jgi:DNA polymerase epsilon subunit 2
MFNLRRYIKDFPRLRQEARWVIVPGPGDPGVSAALPRPALRPSLTGKLREALPRATFASNPARVRFRSQVRLNPKPSPPNPES